MFKREFDYIHGREIEGCIADETQLFRQAFENLKSGGYFELQCAYPYWLSDDDTAEKATNAQLWVKHAREASEKFGKSLTNAPTFKDKMKEVGFVDIDEMVYKVSILKMRWCFLIAPSRPPY